MSSQHWWDIGKRLAEAERLCAKHELKMHDLLLDIDILHRQRKVLENQIAAILRELAIAGIKP